MSAGIQIFSDTDVLTIDGQHFNYEFTRKGSTTGNLSFSSNRGASPLVFIRTTNAGFGRGLVGLGGADYVFEWSGSYSYWIFEPPVFVPESGSGIQIFDSNSKMVFTTDVRPLKIAHMLSYSRRDRIYSNQGYWIGTKSPQITSPVATVVVPNAWSLAYAPALPESSGVRTLGLGRNENFDFQTNWLRETFLTTDTGFTIGEVVDETVVGLIESGQYPPYGDYANPWLSLPGVILAVDVSGL
ncbi:hypothetical protein ACLO87_09330 [Paenalcaligenes sp. Me52]|uniref:hypothetical protein n=1 Tax=Paenalcaligenes sp. Me52 TaxID=3392038 RepID=UPI003D29427A